MKAEAPPRAPAALTNENLLSVVIMRKEKTKRSRRPQLRFYEHETNTDACAAVHNLSA